MNKKNNIMDRGTIIKISLLSSGYCLTYMWSGILECRCKLAQVIKKDVAMGRYNKALDSLEEVKGSNLYRISKYFDKEDPMLLTIPEWY